MAWSTERILGRARGRLAAVRGAITVPANRGPAIRRATARLLGELLERNRLTRGRIVSALFTSTPDLDADFPAHAARRMGWTNVPMLGAVEVAVPGGLKRVVRVLLLVDGVPAGTRLVPAYLDGAARLRPDWAKTPRKRSRPTRRIAIIGLGQIGGSIGLGLAGNAAWRRVGFDRATMRRALRLGVIDEVAPTLKAACRNADLAVVAVPMNRMVGLLPRVARLLPPGAVLLDVGSARGAVVAAQRRAAAMGARVVGGNLMAGSAGRGLAAAQPDLFVGAPFVLWPKRVPPAVRELVRDLGARAIVVSPGRHDHALARTSHLPYLIARSLAKLGAAPARAGLSGPSFRDITRVAASDPRMAMAYCGSNARELKAAWRELMREVEGLLRKL